MNYVILSIIKSLIYSCTQIRMHSNYNKNEKIICIYLKYIDMAPMKDRKISSSSLCALIQGYSHKCWARFPFRTIPLRSITYFRERQLHSMVFL